MKQSIHRIARAFLICGGPGYWTDAKSVAGALRTHFRSLRSTAFWRLEMLVSRTVETSIRTGEPIYGGWTFDRKTEPDGRVKYCIYPAPESANPNRPNPSQSFRPNNKSNGNR